MKRNRFLIGNLVLVLLLAAVLVSACAQPAPAPAPTTAPSPTTAPAPTTSAAPAPKPTTAPATTAAPAPKPAAKIPVLIAAGQPTWGTYPVAVATADMFNKSTNLDITTRSTSGSLAIIQTVAEGKADFAFGTRDFLWGTLYVGAQDFAGKPNKNVRAVIEFQAINMSLIVPRERPIRAITDFKGKRIGWHTTSGMEQVEAWLKANSLDPTKDIIKVTVPGQAESVQEIIAGRNDAVWQNIFSTNAIELAQAFGTVYPVTWKQSDYDWIKQNQPLIVMGSVLKRIMPGVRDHLYIPPEGVLVMATNTSVATRADVSAEVVYTYTKAWLTNMKEIQKINADMAYFTPELIQTPSAIPYHEGAVKAFKEAGLWSAEMEKVQQELLK